MAYMGQRKGAYRILVVGKKPEGKGLFGRSMCRY